MGSLCSKPCASEDLGSLRLHDHASSNVFETVTGKEKETEVDCWDVTRLRPLDFANVISHLQANFMEGTREWFLEDFTQWLGQDCIQWALTPS